MKKLIVDVEGDAIRVTISDGIDYRPEVLRDWCSRALEVIHAQDELAADSASV